jgi:hypothetical protein
MMSPVSEDETIQAQPPSSTPASSVLAQLPRTRPQRSSARRSAAREAPAKRAAAAAPRARPAPTKAAAKPSRARKTAARKPPSRARPRTHTRAEEPVPLQGYASDGEALSGSVPPPGGPELVATAAEIVGELAKAGASGGERVVKGLLSRLGL